MRVWLALLFVIFSGVTALLSQWTYLPAGYANVNAVVSDPSGELIWVCTVDAGLWKSIDGGQNWIPANPMVPLPPNAIINRLSALDSQCDTMILQSGQFFYTFNSGNSWELISALDNNPAEALAFWRADRHTWLACNHDVFARSNNFGETWITFPFEDGLVREGIYQDRFVDSTLFVLGDYIYAQGHAGGGLLRSNDLGETWEEIADLHGLFGLEFAIFKDVLRLSNGDLIALLPYAYLDQSTGWTDGQILLSTNDGLTWNRIYGGVTSHFQPQQIIEDQNVPGRLFLIGLSAFGIYWSQDYGQNWERCLNGLPENVSYCSDLKQNAFTGQITVCIGGIGIFASVDDGESWNALPQPPIGSYGAISYTGQTVFFRDGGERQWQLNEDAENWVDLDMPLAQDTLFSYAPMCIRRGDTLVAAAHIRPFGQDSEYIQIMQSFDAGNTWDRLPFLPLAPNSFPYIFESETLSAIWLRGFEDELLRVSRDLGMTWQERQPPADLFVRGIIENESATYLVGNNGSSLSEIFRSTDSGEIWYALNYPGSYLYGTRTLVPFGNDLFVKTEDGVNSHCLFWSDSVWEERGQIAETDFFIRTLAIELPEDTLLLGAATSNHIWFSSDFGYTWESRQFELPYPEQNAWLTSDMVYRDSDRTVWVMTGVGVCYLELSALSTGKNPLVFKPADYTLLSVYPNPFNSETRIRYDLLKRESVEISVYDLQGRLVETLADEVQSAGRHELNLAMRDVASGVYFVQLRTSEAHRVQKVVLLK